MALDPSGTAGMTTEAGAGVGEDGVSGQGVSIMVTSAAGGEECSALRLISFDFCLFYLIFAKFLYVSALRLLSLKVD